MGTHIGIPKETKIGEYRVSLVPSDVKKLVDSGLQVSIEKNAGLGSGYNDKEYVQAGAKIKSNVHDTEMIVKVKRPLIDKIKQHQVIMAYLHIEKGQDPELLDILLEKNTISYAFEEIRDANNKRKVTLGREAGIVGMFEALRIYGSILENHKKKNPFKDLQPMRIYFDKEKAYDALRKINLDREINVAIMGCGNVSQGAQEVLERIELEPQILYRTETSRIKDYLADIDICINATTWKPGDPHIIKKDDLNMMKKTALVADLSCDREGGIQTCIPATWDNPIYKVNKITHFCVDNLPSAIPRQSSKRLSEMITPYVLSVANGEDIKSGLMTKHGKIMFNTMSSPLRGVKTSFFHYLGEDSIVSLFSPNIFKYF